MRLFFSLILISCFSVLGKAQSLNEKELKSLRLTIGTNIANSEALYPSGFRPSEYIVCLLEVDSLGKIASIHLLADEAGKGKTYLILSKMTPILFEKNSFPNARKKTISFPIASISPENKPSYISELFSKDKWKQTSILGEMGNLVSLSPMRYETPIPVVDVIKKWPKELDSLKQKAVKNN